MEKVASCQVGALHEAGCLLALSACPEGDIEWQWSL